MSDPENISEPERVEHVDPTDNSPRGRARRARFGVPEPPPAGTGPVVDPPAGAAPAVSTLPMTGTDPEYLKRHPEEAVPLTGIDLPLWRCHKVVQAIKIGRIDWNPDGSAGLQSEDPAYLGIAVSAAYMSKHTPTVGGYYVRYEDGYESFSPPAPFESGYVRITSSIPVAPPMPVANEQVEAIARVCHEANRAYCVVVGDPGLPGWDELEESYRESTRVGVRGALGGRTAKESHIAWMGERLSQGWVLGEVLDREAKVHPNLVPYEELPEAQKRKDQLFLAIVSALR